MDGILTVVPKQAKVVRRIFSDYIGGKSSNQIAKELTAEGHKTIRGAGFDDQAVLYILKNITYTGNLLLQKTVTVDAISKKRIRNKGQYIRYMAEETHVAIIDMETFDKVQALIKERNSRGCSRFLGYDKGPDGKPVINEEQAKIVRRIFSEYISGKSSTEIVRDLQKDGIPTPSGEGRWCCSSSVLSILQNEKYKGDALIQKTYTESYLTHKSVKNKGELPSYYIEDDHEAIVSKEVFELAQVIRKSKKKTTQYRKNLFSQKLVCAECGGLFTKSTWTSTKGTTIRAYTDSESIIEPSPD